PKWYGSRTLWQGGFDIILTAETRKNRVTGRKQGSGSALSLVLDPRPSAKGARRTAALPAELRRASRMVISGDVVFYIAIMSSTIKASHRIDFPTIGFRRAMKAVRSS